jgi:FkbM family methyltransferase
MMGSLKEVLVRWRIYNFLRYSYLFTPYTHIFRRDLIRAQKKEVEFYRSFLPDCNLIFDIGAFDGHKAAALLRFTKKIVCCEPDSKNFQLLARQFSGTGKVQLLQIALSNQIGLEKFMVHHPGSAFNTLSAKWKDTLEREGAIRYGETFHFNSAANIEIPTITLDHLIGKFGVPDFIKIDVEGYEMKVLLGLSQAVRYISFECNLPDFFEETIGCIDLLTRLSATAAFNYAVDENLQLREFVGCRDFVTVFRGITAGCCEVICKMQK